jgi:hypothetical protein
MQYINTYNDVIFGSQQYQQLCNTLDFVDGGCFAVVLIGSKGNGIVRSVLFRIPRDSPSDPVLYCEF